MKLLLYTSDTRLKTLYYESIYYHNKKLDEDKYYDAGFDLYVPEQITAVSDKTLKLDLKVICAAYLDSNSKPMSYFMAPRSSISKTPLRLANSVGIIDSGYRGNLIAMLDNNSKKDFSIEQNKKLMQVCAPNLEPIRVKLVDRIEELGNTERGSGGFGSTDNTVNNYFGSSEAI